MLSFANVGPTLGHAYARAKKLSHRDWSKNCGRVSLFVDKAPFSAPTEQICGRIGVCTFRPNHPGLDEEV
jgi:hypothetical protein